MSDKRFICGLGFPINSDDPIHIISDSVENKDYYKFSDICNVLNKQQATISQLQKKVSEYELLYNSCSMERDEFFRGATENAKLVGEQQVTIRKLQDLCGESDGENAKLRIENKRLQEEIKLLKPTNIEQYEQIQELQEENEQLKNKLNKGL